MSLQFYCDVVVHCIHRPRTWPEVGRLARRRLAGLLRGQPVGRAAREAESRAGTAWCEERAISSEDALRRAGIDQPLISLEQTHPDRIARAREELAACPWPLGGAGNLDLAFTVCEGLAARRVVETGVAFGWSSLAFLLSLSKRSGSLLVSVDLPYLAFANEKWIGRAVPAELRDGWLMYRMADREGLPRALESAGPVDLAHYDSDKSAEGRRFAHRLLWEALRGGGILMSDDVGDNLAFRNFCGEAGAEPIVVGDGRKFQGLAVKLDV